MPKQDKKKLLKSKIQAELNQTNKKWKGTKKIHRIVRNQSRISKPIRTAVNTTGTNFGCHTCLSLIHNDKNQPWIGDHIPPTNLSNSARNFYNCSDNTVLYPQCDVCASQQSTLVLKLNRLSGQNFPALTDKEKKLINGKVPKTTKNCIPSSSTVVTSGEGIAIQALGERYGCHSCGRKTPVSTYHSDHVFPQEFMTSYMPQVFKLLGLPAVDYQALEVRPQCPRCSHKQGGNMNQITRLAIQVARENGIVVYKG